MQLICVLRICPLNVFTSHSLVSMGRLYVSQDSRLFSTSLTATHKIIPSVYCQESIMNLTQCTKFITILCEKISPKSQDFYFILLAWETTAIVFEDFCIFSIPLYWHLKIYSALQTNIYIYIYMYLSIYIVYIKSSVYEDALISWNTFSENIQMIRSNNENTQPLVTDSQL